MSISDDLAHDDEYFETFLRLTQSIAEQTLSEHEELSEHGFTVLEVVGSPVLLYRRGGKTYTKDYALAVVRAIPDPRGER